MLLILIVCSGKESFPRLPQFFMQSNERRSRRILVSAVDAIRSEAKTNRCDNNRAQRQPVGKLKRSQIDFEPGRPVVCAAPPEGEFAIPLDMPEPLPVDVALGATGVCLTPPIACCRWAVVKPFFI